MPDQQFQGGEKIPFDPSMLGESAEKRDTSIVQPKLADVTDDLAAQLFGAQDENEDAPDPEASVAPKEMEDGENEDEKEAAAPETGESEQDGQATDDDEGNAGYTLAEAAKALGVDAESLYAMDISVDVDGESQKMSIGELKDAYNQLRTGGSTAQTEALNTRVQEVEQREGALQQQIEQRIAAIGQIEQETLSAQMQMHQAQQTMQALEGEAGQKLASEDPGRLALLKQNAIQQYQAAQGQLGQHQQQAQQQIQQRLQAEAQEAVRKVPGWADEAGRPVIETIQRDRAAMAAVASDYGVTAQEIESQADHRTLWMLRDLAKYKAQLANAKPEARKRAPKQRLSLKALAASRNTGDSAAKTNLDALIKHARDTKSPRATVDAGTAMLQQAGLFR